MRFPPSDIHEPLANSPGFQPVRSGTQSSSPILNLAEGTTVGSGSMFSTFVQGSGGATLEAIVRTNDPSLTLFGETSTTLAPGSWTTNGVSVTTSPDQTGVLPGCQRRLFSVPAAPEAKKFLRLRAVSP